MLNSQHQPIGIIEGFYGNAWSHCERLKFPRLLAQLGLNTYVYCPKSDAYLRRRWKEDWPNIFWRDLLNFSLECKSTGIDLGIGLSPYELYKSYTERNKIRLKEKIDRILELNPKYIFILFDDMSGDFCNIAETQTIIANDISYWANSAQIYFCPTYYSFDPVLETVFGEKPSGYNEKIGRLLDSNVEILWTGNQVCSEEINTKHIILANEVFGRRITLWDNYSANDGKIRSNHLYLKPLPNREASISNYLNGHLCNAMTQSELSLITLSGLSRLHNCAVDTEKWLENRLGKKFLTLINRDLSEFEETGLKFIGEEKRSEMIRDYKTIGSRSAWEIIRWLQGHYEFNSHSLTD